MKITSVVLILLCCFFGSEAQFQDEIKLLELRDHGNVTAEFTYTTFGAISEEKRENTFRQYNYDSRHRLSSITFFMDPRVVSATAHPKKNRLDWTTPLNTKSDYEPVYKYDSAGQIVKSIQRGEILYIYRKNKLVGIEYFANDQKFKTRVFTYDKSGNLTKEVNTQITPSGKNGIREVITYLYDKMHNPFFNFHLRTEPGRYANPNNIISTTIDGHEMKTTYQYDKDGYPISDSHGTEFTYK